MNPIETLILNLLEGIEPAFKDAIEFLKAKITSGANLTAEEAKQELENILTGVESLIPKYAQFLENCKKAIDAIDTAINSFPK